MNHFFILVTVGIFGPKKRKFQGNGENCTMTAYIIVPNSVNYYVNKIKNCEYGQVTHIFLFHFGPHWSMRHP
jgi:hypothetical protein